MDFLKIMRAAFIPLLISLLLPSALAAATDGTLRWAFNTTGIIVSSPTSSADGSRVYFGSEDGYLYAINSNTGALAWSRYTSDWVDSSPAVGADGTIYVGSWSGRLHAYRADGLPKWNYLTGSSISSSPAVGSDGTIYIGSSDFYLYALTSLGGLKWKYFAGDAVRGSPSIGPDGTIYVSDDSDVLHAVNPDGTQQWEYQATVPTNAVDAIGSTSPAIGLDGTIYVGFRDGKIHAFSPSGQQLWEYATDDAIESSVSLDTSGNLYFCSTDSNIYSLTSSGALRWAIATGTSLYSTPTIRADGSLIVGTSDNTILCLSTSDGSQLWKYTTGDYVDSSPLVTANGTIYVGCYDKKLYSLNGNGQTLDNNAAWPAFHRDIRRQGRARQNQTLTFASLPDLAYTSTPFGLSASASSGLTVVFSVVSGPASLSGTQITLTGDGDVAVKASQAGSDEYAAVSVTQSFTVLPTFTSWSLAHFTATERADSSISGFSADPDIDTFTNLVEYALGYDPKAISLTNPPTTTTDGTNWIYTYRRPSDRSDLTYSVEWCNDLTTAAWSSTGLSTSIVTGIDGWQTCRITLPLASATRTFFKLIVTRTP